MISNLFSFHTILDHREEWCHYFIIYNYWDLAMWDLAEVSGFQTICFLLLSLIIPPAKHRSYGNAEIPNSQLLWAWKTYCQTACLLVQPLGQRWCKHLSLCSASAARNVRGHPGLPLTSQVKRAAGCRRGPRKHEPWPDSPVSERHDFGEQYTCSQPISLSQTLTLLLLITIMVPPFWQVHRWDGDGHTIHHSVRCRLSHSTFTALRRPATDVQRWHESLTPKEQDFDGRCNATLPVWQPLPHVTTGHLKHGSSKLRCAVNVNYTLDLKSNFSLLFYIDWTWKWDYFGLWG